MKNLYDDIISISIDRSPIVTSICIFFLLHMPLKKKVKTARKKLQGLARNIKTGQFEKALNVFELDFSQSDSDFSENEDFSSDSDDNFENNLLQTINNLGKLELVWLKKRKKHLEIGL